jgi:hypothetical protein
MTPAKSSTRREVYRHSSILRHKLNKQKREEPKNVSDVLP